jgi:hypothetical protein
MSAINYTKATDESKVKRNTFGKYVLNIRVHFFSLTLHNKGNMRADQTTKQAHLVSFSNAVQREHSLFIRQLKESSNKHYLPHIMFMYKN